MHFQDANLLIIEQYLYNQVGNQKLSNNFIRRGSTFYSFFSRMSDGTVIGLEESIYCPSFDDLSDEYEPRILYLAANFNWCYLAEVVKDMGYSRPLALVKDLDGEQHLIAFYLDNTTSRQVLESMRFNTGETIALLYPQRKTFLDGQKGIRVETPDYKVFKCSRSTLVAESQKFQSNACFACGKENEKLSRCGKCKIAAYCGKECQTSHWSIHKSLCPDQKVLKNLVNLIKSPMTEKYTFKKLETSVFD